jgi:hypothetical protein
MAPTTANSTGTPEAALQAELGATCGLVCPWLGLLGGIVTVGSGVGAGSSGVIGAVNLSESITCHQ